MRIKIIVLLSLFALSVQLEAQSQLIDEAHPLYTIAAKFVKARNEADTSKRLSMLKQIVGTGDYPPYSSNGFLGDMMASGGNFEPHSVFLVGNGAALHIVGQEERTKEWMRYQLGLLKPQNRIGMIAQTPSRVPKPLPVGALSSTKVLDFIRSDFADLANEIGYSGSLLIMDKGKQILEEYQGNASDRSGILIDAKTPLSMASGSKMMTALMIAMAVEEKKLKWDQALYELVPALKKYAWSKQIQVKHLLSHTSGLAEYWDDAFDRRKAPIKQLNDFIPYFANKRLEFKPGAQANYVNTNFIVLGMVLESIYAVNYDELVQEKILGPLGMNDTYYGPTGKDVEYYWPGAPGTWAAMASMSNSGSSPAGGMHSTPQDLSKLASALLNNTLLSQETLRLMTSPQSDLGSGKYGFGFEVSLDTPVHFGHGGRGPGHHFAFKIYPEEQRVLILMTNRDSSQFLDFLLNLQTLVGRY